MSTTARTQSGDLVIPRQILTAPADVSVQSAVDVLSLWAKSWPFDQSAGFPWGAILGVKNLSVPLARKLLRDAILSVPYVVSVDVQVYFDPSTRALAYTFLAPLNTGAVLTGGSAQPFRVQQQGGATSG